jgi:hypothetical protein
VWQFIAALSGKRLKLPHNIASQKKSGDQSPHSKTISVSGWFNEILD